VQPWFYVRDTEPPLGDEYTAPPSRTVTGNRVDVTLDQIIAAMGPRNPDDRSSQKVFRMLFVVLERADAPILPGSGDLSFRSDFELRFRIATGGRGAVTTEAAVAPPEADFALPADARVGTEVSFTDTSKGNPVQWSWTFGDGGTSTARNPSHVFATPGTYTIQVVVRNSKGTDTISKALTVQSVSLRHRAVRR